MTQEQEPDYWFGFGLQAHTEKPFEGATPIYTTPPQRTWVGLTDEEMLECNMDGDLMIDRETAKRNVEAKLKEKNT